ncbi:FecCD family ABC transporter permease [Streptacidiphilus neutrinimicus]|uniref:FecCD family ABC transporter permease n=1 Tax=Streptacidiphilus neutrinimicus TaxID=105420 RepID=UPI000694A7BE|nr:iron chelate uptake ABC transporter family permease subunit [Streptacidiphilus neutrinimicus]
MSALLRSRAGDAAPVRAVDRSVRRARLVTTLLLLAAPTVAVLALAGGGDLALAPADVVRALVDPGSATADPATHFVVWELRLPRVTTGLLAGAALALSGAVFQSLTRNPLGSPDVLGFTQGAATGALTATVLLGGGGGVLALPLPLGAVVGALAAGGAVVVLARGGRQQLVLVGIAVGAVLSGVNGYLLTRGQLTDAARAVLWLTGSLDGGDGTDAAVIALALALLAPVVLAQARSLALLELGDDAATALGVPVARTRRALLCAALLLAAAAAATVGPVAFLALTAPQLARRLTRAPGPNLLPSAATGALLLVLADWAAQRAVPGHQLPVGVVTGLLGGGYLVRLLVKERRSARV